MNSPKQLTDALTVDAAATTRLLEIFLKQELERTGLTKYVVGLSGGIDSAVSTYLACRAIGPENVFTVKMPYRTSSSDSVSDADAVIDDLGCPAETVDISPMVDGFLQTSGEIGSLRAGNVMARARMIVLFDRSAKHGALVLGTSNKTELLLGYSTLHGDGASALNPIGDLYKTQVRQLAEWLGVPESIRLKAPSADLWPDQSDEDELGFTYEEVDRLMIRMIDARVCREHLIRDGFPEALIDRVQKLIVRTQFKRRPPVIAKVSTRTVGWDFRYPRDWLT